MDYLMAIDLGSTSLKAVIYDLDGNRIASASRPTEKITPKGHPEWVVWEPDQIWQGAAAACKEAMSTIDDPTLVKAVAVTGMGMDGVPVDAQGHHLYPFISWHDPRTAPQAEWWNEKVGAEKTFSIAGFPTWAITAAMRILWMNEHEPEIMKKAKKWLLIEDFVNHKLCARIATDYSMASCMLLFDQTAQTWSDELIEASGIDKTLLPDPVQSGTVLGKITAEACALTGLSTDTTVVLGGHDHICGTLPIGVYKPGTVLDIIGTWEIISTAVASPVLDPAISAAGLCMQSHVVKNMHSAWGAAVSGESLEWFRKEFGFEAEQKAEKDGGVVWTHLLSWLADTKPGASGAMFLPHISASGCPINDNRSLGAFVGLSNTVTKGDMLRAVIEGLNYQFLHIIEVMESNLNCKLEHITIAGGVAQNEFWIQNKVDMLGMPMEVSDIQDATPLGCAMLAGVGVGLYRDMDEAYDRVKKSGKVYQPNKDLTKQYARLFKIYKSMYPALMNLNHTIFGQFKG
jgi:xylulokinase